MSCTLSVFGARRLDQAFSRKITNAGSLSAPSRDAFSLFGILQLNSSPDRIQSKRLLVEHSKSYRMNETGGKSVNIFPIFRIEMCPTLETTMDVAINLFLLKMEKGCERNEKCVSKERRKKYSANILRHHV